MGKGHGKLESYCSRDTETEGHEEKQVEISRERDHNPAERRPNNVISGPAGVNQMAHSSRSTYRKEGSPYSWLAGYP